MEKRQFRFKREYFEINGIYNIPGLIICSGHGYDLRTYCCKTCGEIFVIDGQLLFERNGDLQEIIEKKTCPICKTPLENNLLKYPENIFYQGTCQTNKSNIDNLHFAETELIDTYEIKV